MQIAVITPYFREPPDVLLKCHESVRAQTHPCTHFMVADGFPRPEISSWPVQHIILARSHGDVGNTPRAMGALSAMNQGFEAIAFLDADNWYYPNHIDAMVRLHEQTGAAVCTAGRSMHRLDGSLLYADKECDGVEHVDTSCYFFTKDAFRVLPVWAMMPAQLAPAGDRIIWNLIRSLKLPRVHNPEPTIAYRTQYDAHYQQAGEPPPPGSKTNIGSAGKALQWWAALPRAEQEDWERRMGLRR